MPKCPNCGQETARTEDWACQWCGYSLLSQSYEKIPKTYEQLQEEKLRKKKPPVAVETGPPPFAKETQAQIVVRSRFDKVVRIFLTLVGCLLIAIGVYVGYNLGFYASGLICILIGGIVPDMGTKVTFNQPPGYMTVTRRFCWLFSRRKRVSREEARNVRVRSVWRLSSMPHGHGWAYQVRVTMKSGKEVSLYIGWERDRADYLAQKILDFGQQ